MTGEADLGEVSGWLYRSPLMPPGAIVHDSAGVTDVTVTFGAVPTAPEELGPGHPVWRTLADKRVLLSLPGIGRFSISGGDRVEVAPADGADPTTLGLLLSGPILAVLLRQRGLLPFDGAALGWNGGAFLIVGPSGVGKSSLAAALALKGWPVLADGVLGVSPSAGELMRGAPRLRLWRSAAQALGVDLTGCAPLRPGEARFDTLWPGHSPGPWPITGIAIVLNRAASPACEPLSPGRALACLTRSLWSRPAFGEDRAGATALMADLGGLASSVPCWRLTVGEELEALGTTASLLQQMPGRRYSPSVL